MMGRTRAALAVAIPMLGLAGCADTLVEGGPYLDAGARSGTASAGPPTHSAPAAPRLDLAADECVRHGVIVTLTSTPAAIPGGSIMDYAAGAGHPNIVTAVRAARFDLESPEEAYHYRTRRFGPDEARVQRLLDGRVVAVAELYRGQGGWLVGGVLDRRCPRAGR